MVQQAVLVSLVFLVSLLSFPRQAHAADASAPQKDWTILVFLNGHNNLDSFGTKDMLEMEKVGSGDKVNVVVQWASLAADKTRRLLVKKSTNSTVVTSPVVQSLPRVDMGDYHSLVEFVRWGVQNYPAKHYLVDIWNHGSGWRKTTLDQWGAKDISFDDVSGHSISTLQLGQALRDSASIIGHKVDLYGSDACLMGMAEIADELSDSVDVFAGSEEVEPANGWPYDLLINRMNDMADASPANVGKALAEEYVKSYQNGSQGDDDATFSVFDLSHMAELNSAVKALGDRLKSLSGAERTTVAGAFRSTQKFTYSDYGDLLDFASIVQAANLASLKGDVIPNLQQAAKNFIVANQATARYSHANGLAIWLPTSSSTYKQYVAKYRGLKFSGDTGWDSALNSVLQ